LKEDYWSVFESVPGNELARTLRLVRDSKYGSPLPRVSQLSPEERLAVEEENILQCLAYSKNKLGLV
jgi:3-oxoisoapionate decarboxylase